MVKKSICFLFVVLLLSSCRKEKFVSLITDTLPDPTIPARPPHPMVKTITITDYQGNITVEYYYYDTLWRLKTLRRTSATSNFVDSATYYPTFVEWLYSADLRLSTNGLAYEDNNFSWYAQRHYSYNTDSFLTYEYSMSGSASYTYDNNKNVVTSHSQTEANPPNYIYYDYIYAYNSHLNTIGNYNTGEYYFGKSSTNLVERKVASWHYNADPPHTWSVFYNYTYNDSGWVSRMETNQETFTATQIDSVTVIYDTAYYHTQLDYTYY